MIWFLEFILFPAKSADKCIAAQGELIKILKENNKLQRVVIEGQQKLIKEYERVVRREP